MTELRTKTYNHELDNIFLALAVNELIFEVKKGRSATWSAGAERSRCTVSDIEATVLAPTSLSREVTEVHKQQIILMATPSPSPFFATCKVIKTGWWRPQNDRG